MYWHGFCAVSVTLYDASIMLAKKNLDIHLRSDSTELAEAVPIEQALSVQNKMKVDVNMLVNIANVRNANNMPDLTSSIGKIYLLLAL